MRVLNLPMVEGPIECVDVSEFRPEEKEAAEFRNYVDSPRIAIVRETYRLMHENQSVEFVQGQRAKWCRFDHCEMTIMEALDELNKLIDDSDPDVDIPNIVHAFQTAERLRQHHPGKDWLHLTGLIHDLGKVMALWGEPQWAVVGDTYPVGCAADSSIVFAEQCAKGPDAQDQRYNTQLGMYERNCGLDNVLMSWGHDEYLYQVLKHNKCTIPDEGMAMIRFHSFYPWHTGNAYGHLTNSKDEAMLPWVREMNKFDLYSKDSCMPDIEALIPYYQGLIDKYCPGNLEW